MYHYVFLFFAIRYHLCLSVTIYYIYIYSHTNIDSLLYTPFLLFCIDILNSIKTVSNNVTIFSFSEQEQIKLMIQLSIVNIFRSLNLKFTSQTNMRNYFHYQVSPSTAPMLHAQ